MRRRHLRFAVLLSLVPTPVMAGDLVLNFTTSIAAGQVRAMVFNDPVAFAERQRPLAALVMPVVGGQVRATLSGLPSGRLAIAAYQDMNGDGKLNTSWLGIPEEPVGFSMTDESSPDFQQAAFPLSMEGATVTVRLR